MAGFTFLRVLVSLLASVRSQCLSKGPYPGQIKNLVTFGDSYTDVSDPGDNSTSWPTFAAQDGGFNLYPFARSGATCSNNLTPTAHFWPSLMEYQLPTYYTDVANGTLQLNPDESVYTVWIGTNDVGVNALLTAGQEPGVTLVNTTGCVMEWVRKLYASGARNFVIQNLAPLQDTVLYSIDSYPSLYWTKPRNSTGWHITMAGLTKTANELLELKQHAMLPSLQGAHVGIFDSYQLISDMYNNPQDFLGGPAPYNVTGCIHSCVFALNEPPSHSGPADCYITNGTRRNSFLWYDELHPSEEANRVIGREIAAGIKNTPSSSSKYMRWLV